MKVVCKPALLRNKGRPKIYKPGEEMAEIILTEISLTYKYLNDCEETQNMKEHQKYNGLRTTLFSNNKFAD